MQIWVALEKVGVAPHNSIIYVAYMHICMPVSMQLIRFTVKYYYGINELQSTPICRRQSHLAHMHCDCWLNENVHINILTEDIVHMQTLRMKRVILEKKERKEESKQILSSRLECIAYISYSSSIILICCISMTNANRFVRY